LPVAPPVVLPVSPPTELPVSPTEVLPETEVQPPEALPIEALPVEFLPVEVLPVTLETFEVMPAESTVPPRSFSMPPDVGRRFRSRREEKEERKERKEREQREQREKDAKDQQEPRKKEKKVRQRPLSQAVRKLKDTHRVLFWTIIAVLAASVALIALFQLFTPGVVSDQAMEDTLKQNKNIVVYKAAYWFDQPQYNDIVLYKTPAYSGDGSENPTVGRIVGLPGDRISIWDGSVYRNDIKLDEPYVKGGVTSSRLTEIVVKEGTYFILGDNRDASRDSRHRDVGLISKSQIVGKVIVPKIK